MAKKPAENTPFGDMITSSVFSTEREDPFFNEDVEENEHWKDKNNTRKNMRGNDKSIGNVDFWEMTVPFKYKNWSPKNG